VRSARTAEQARRRRLGQFFTPDAVADFAVRVLEPHIALGAEGDSPRVRSSNGVRIVDPAAGDGVFLRAARRLLGDRVADSVGLDIDRAAADCGADAGVRLGHGLLEDLGVFDVALGNPPYAADGMRCLSGLADGNRSEDAWRLAAHVLGQSVLWRHRVGCEAPLEDLRARRMTRALAAELHRAARFPIEILFVERFVSLLKPGGWMAVVLPEGLLANARWAFVRDWLEASGRLHAVFGLPRLFARAGATARTALVVYRRSFPANGALDQSTRGPVLMADAGAEWLGARRPVNDYLADVLRGSATICVSADALRGQRWDPQFWNPRHANPLDGLARGTVGLGDFIEDITYGPIVTRRFPREFPGDVPVVSQPQFEDSGINLAHAARVESDGIFDPPRSRARAGDLLFPRSGVGTLGRNRLAVYDGDVAVNVGCFVDRIRLCGVNPWFVWVFLRTRFGWGQIRRVIHGVGMPNISFDEIRALRIPLVPADEQAAVETAWRARVAPLHEALVRACARREKEAPLRAKAAEAFLGLVRELEGRLT